MNRESNRKILRTQLYSKSKIWLVDFIFDDKASGDVKLPKMPEKGISLRGVSFGYEDKQILTDINIDFEPGKKYAIVGSSGAGKTTLLNLLMQAYDNYEGSVTLDGIELRDIEPDSLFNIFSPVQQNVFVFNDTIYNNVTLYKDFAKEDVEAAILRAGLSEIVELHGTDYICGDNGSALSGGEKQRISIARALLKEAHVLLMDEATAALDEVTANAIMNAVLGMEDITEIVVTHRLDESILRQYDEILLLHHGEIAEKGNFDELIKCGGIFYSLFTISQ